MIKHYFDRVVEEKYKELSKGRKIYYKNYFIKLDEIVKTKNVGVGKILDEGTYKKLVKQKGIYNKILELQSGF